MLQGVKLENDDDWCINVICEHHNHPPAAQLEGHSFTGRLNKDEENVLLDMTKNMVKPRNILLTIKDKNEKNTTTMKTIYNVRHKYRTIERDGRSQMQQLMKQLNDYKYVEWHRRNETTDCVTDLFWAHPASIKMLHVFPLVLLMDCTYKTNRYGFPLLEIVGVTCTDLTFSIAFVYMEAERQENYTWAMEKLRSLLATNIVPKVIVTDRDLALMKSVKKVFPETENLLCRFHITKNVLANSKKLFKCKDECDGFMAAWSGLTFSSCDMDYAKNLNVIQSDYQNYPSVIEYVRDTWLNPYKERFVAAWTNKIMHFGNLTTNRAESAHAKLKKLLGSSQLDFDCSWKTINALILLQHTEIKASFEQSLNVVEHNFRPALFKELRGLISRKALNLILTESERANDVGLDTKLCGCVMRSTHGLPCAHEIVEYVRCAKPIPISDINPHWMRLNMQKHQESDVPFEISIDTEMNSIWTRFQRCDQAGKLALKRKLRELGDPATTFLIPPPEKVKTKGRPPLKANSSTRRDPSYFEIVESEVAKCDSELGEKRVVDQKVRKKIVKKKTKSLLNYLGYLPSYLHPYIFDIIDVKPDGHCGFRAIASLLGFGEEKWAKVREDLIEELCDHRPYYVRFYESAETVAQLLEELSYFRVPAPFKNWMTLPHMGHLVASRYKVVLVFLSKPVCVTFLPLRSNPPLQHHRVLVLGFVNGNHYIQVCKRLGFNGSF
ncbi:unnamed protein product, partial [Cuscuta epithymum]